MQPTKSRNGYTFTPRADKHMFIPPGSLSKGRAQGSRSFHSFGSSSQSAFLDTVNHVTPPLDTPIMQSNDISVPSNLEPMEELREAEHFQDTWEELYVIVIFVPYVCTLGRTDGEQKKHMWAAMTDKFEHEKMEDYCDETLVHMKDLWNKWRGDLHRKFIKPSSIKEALKNVPEGVERDDWEWLVKEHFSSEKFLAASKRNSNNRAKLSMPHRTGSKPIRQVIWKKGGKVGEPPSLATIFFETRKKGSMLVEQETISTCDKIVDVTQAEPSLSNIELVEKCFGPQRHDHIVCYGGGLKPNDMRTNGSKADLRSKLRESQRENQSLKNRMDEMENEVRMIKEMLQRQQSSTSLPPSNGQSI